MNITNEKQIMDDLYSKIKYLNEPEYGGVTAASISIIVLKIMQLTEQISEDGPTKKKVAISLMHRLIRDSNNTKKNKEDLIVLVDVVVPDMIDTLISVDKKKLVINTSKKFKNCFCV